MNFQEYMKKVEDRLSVMTEDKKTAVLRNMLRGADETKREEILRLLNNETQDLFFGKEYEALYLFCNEIETGVKHFFVSGYEEDQEAPWGEEYYEEYDDRDRIGLRYKYFISLAEKLLYSRCYKEALNFYEPLIDLIFSAYSDEYEELIEMSVEQAIEEKLISTDLRKNIINLLYSCYQVYSGEERCVKIYRILAPMAHEKIKIDEFFSAGPEELKDGEVFLEKWIEYLSTNEEDFAGSLLSEASYQFGGTDRLIKAAKDKGTFHPVLYLDACKKLNQEMRYEKVLLLADEAMVKLRKNLVIRSEISKTVQIAANALNLQDVEIKYMKEAYYSDTSPLRFLELCALLKDQEALKEAAWHVRSIQAYAELPEYAKRGQWQENSITMEEKEAILFFSGDWDTLYEKYKTEKESLGWSQVSKGLILPLYLLAIYRHNELQPAGSLLWHSILHRLGRYLLNEEAMNDAFGAWKMKFEMNDTQMNNYFPWVREEVENRVAGIVEHSYRKSYHKAALLVAVLGEVMTSRGEIDAKENLIAFYKKKYNRRRAFRAELDVFLEN